MTFPMIIAGLAAYAALDEGSYRTHNTSEAYYLGNLEAVDAAIIRSLSAFATTVTLVYCHKRNRQFTHPQKDASFVGNLLLMMGTSDEHTKKCLEKLWIVYADHEMTNSTAAFLHSASNLTDPVSCMISGVVSAYGPLHGGKIEHDLMQQWPTRGIKYSVLDRCYRPGPQRVRTHRLARKRTSTHRRRQSQETTPFRLRPPNV